MECSPTDDRRTRLERLVGAQYQALTDLIRPDGHLCFELEADATIPSEYVLLHHFCGKRSPHEPGIRRYLLARQRPDGSWPLFHGGVGNISATVKAYFALKLIGEDPDGEAMQSARAFVLAEGGAAKANVFTRTTLALFGEIPWRGVPVMPVEIMLLPRWFPFHMSKVSYWSRVCIAPLLVLAALKPRAVNPTGCTVRELFITPPDKQREYQVNPTGSMVGHAFLQLDKVLRAAEPIFPKTTRRKAIDQALAFVKERLNGEDGLGAIYPAMANVVMAYHALGIPHDDPDYTIAREAIEKLVTVRGDETYVQPCLSPIWDTALAAHALMEANGSDDAAAKAGLDWLVDRQITETVGDWAVRRPDTPPGGWAFQYANDHYPDVDDTAVIIAALHRNGDPAHQEAIDRAAEWLVGMQSTSGGWGAFEPENEHFYLNSIPFADHGALLDPPTADVTARCVAALAQIDAARYSDAIERGVGYLLRDQEADGSWFGRWGANYIYGTWSVLTALNAAGVPAEHEAIRKAVAFLKAAQRPDGGWGEGLETYEPDRQGFADASTPSQTAWALLALMAAGETDAEETARGIDWLSEAPREGARWAEEHYTGTGFPRVFYLKYHGYAAYFPLWAVARYNALKASNDRTVKWGL